MNKYFLPFTAISLAIAMTAPVHADDKRVLHVYQGQIMLRLTPSAISKNKRDPGCF